MPRRKTVWGRSRTAAGAVALAAVLLGGLAGCFRDRRADPAEVTAEEMAAFAAPSDSTITAEQIDLYLQATISQIERLRGLAPALRDSLARNPPASGPGPKRSPIAVWSDAVDAAYVRAARAEGFNPAEMWYVRGRLAAANGALQAAVGHAQSGGSATLMRQQAELLRGQPGIPQSQIDLMLRAAEQAEAERPPAVPPRLVQNLDVLTRTTPRLDSEERRRLTGMAAGAVSAPLFRLDSASLEATLDSLHALHVRAGERAAPGGG